MLKNRFLSGLALALVAVACSPATPDEANARTRALIARAAEFELDTEWETPPGDPMELATAGFAKILCSAVFITGLDVAAAAENVGYFVSKPEDRALVTDTVVDFENRAVHLTLNTGVTRSAKLYRDQGCVTLPRGADSVFFAPVREWHETPGDPRSAIRIGDLMRMSSGLRFVAPQDPDYDYEFGYPQGYPDHYYVYTGAIDSYEWAITRPAQWPPNTVGRYRNSDPLVVNHLIRNGVEDVLGREYHTYPQRALFDKIGVRRMYLETDPYGNFLLQGYDYGTGRNWARLGMLYLQDGVWNGERILPEGWVEYANTVAPAWEADGNPVYGGSFFWVNRTQTFPVPADAFYMAGAGGQYTIVIPSRDMVVVRLGHYKGAGPGGRALRRALELLMDAVSAGD